MLCGFIFEDTPHNYTEYGPGIVVTTGKKNRIRRIAGTILPLGKLLVELRKSRTPSAVLTRVVRPATNQRPALVRRYVYRKGKIRQVHTFKVNAASTNR